jgi:hypothetical protein
LPRFAADGVGLAYESYGSGGPVGLLYDIRREAWRRNGWMEPLADAGLRPIALDFPAHGGNRFGRLRPHLRGGGRPGGLAARVAGRDEYMQGTAELVRRLEPTRVLQARDRGHHDLLLDEAVRREVIDFLRESSDATVRG